MANESAPYVACEKHNHMHRKEDACPHCERENNVPVVDDQPVTPRRKRKTVNAENDVDDPEGEVS
jgi:hypothetical protein